VKFKSDTSVRKLTAKVPVGSRTFEFPVCTRPLQLGSSSIDYYWIDSSLLRRSAKGTAGNALAESIVAFRYAVLEAGGMQRDHDELQGYVSAKFYPLVAASKSLQDIYLDAFLKSGSTIPECFEMDDETRIRIRKIVSDGSMAAVREEMDRLFERFQPEADDMPGFQEACRQWLGKGMQSQLEEGHEALEDHIREVDVWMAHYRKKGGDDRLRHFVNMFSYESKASFHFCYANAWIGIIDWLKSNEGLETSAERFLRFWHSYQGELGSPFQGHVLALHPLSGFFMKDPTACRAAGRFFGTEAYSDVFERGAAGTSTPYWDLVGAILASGHQYRRAHVGWVRPPNTKDCRDDSQSLDGIEGAAHADTGESALIGIVAAHPEKCEVCGTVTEFQSVGTGNPDTGDFPVTCLCPKCEGRSVRDFTAGHIEAWFGDR